MHKYLQTAEKELFIPSNPVASRGAVLPYANRLVPAAVIAAIVLLGVAYLIQLNVVAAKGFAMRATERRLTELAERQKKMQVELAQKESLAGLSNDIELLGMVPVSKVEYIKVGGASVAVR